MIFTGGRRFAVLCRDLFLLAQEHDPTPGPARGTRWEHRIADALADRGFPALAVPGGVEVHGTVPASGLAHQTDAGIVCVDALVIGEWKAYRGPVPKNEVLRFKAVSDDLYDGLGARVPRRPVLRLFGVSGDASEPLRRYAARHGIALVEHSRWPAPVLADHHLRWPAGAGPSVDDRRRLAWLGRSMQRVYPALPDGTITLPRPPRRTAVDSLLALQDRWSARLWEQLDCSPGSVPHRHARRTAA